MRFDLRFWAENISPRDVVRHGLPLLSEYSAGVGIAVFEESLTAENAGAFREIKNEGVELVMWPLLPREKGYFPGESNVGQFVSLVEEVVGWAEENGVVPDMIAVDQEIPFHQMMQIVEAKPLGLVPLGVKILKSNLDRERYQQAKAELESLNSWIKERGIRTLSACFPWVSLELEESHEVIQDMMETPLAGIGWDIISPMAYVSMLTGMTYGLISSRDANWFTYEVCLRLRNSNPGQAGVSLGLTGTGVFEEEPTFDAPEELMVGVEAALAAGIRDISIYNLEGILSDDPRKWFEAVRSARPRVPERSMKVALGLAAARNLYPLLAGALMTDL